MVYPIFWVLFVRESDALGTFFSDYSCNQSNPLTVVNKKLKESLFVKFEFKIGKSQHFSIF